MGPVESAVVTLGGRGEIPAPLVPGTRSGVGGCFNAAIPELDEGKRGRDAGTAGGRGAAGSFRRFSSVTGSAWTNFGAAASR